MDKVIGEFFGQDIKLPNERLPFFAIVFMGIMAIGSVLYWRHYALLVHELSAYNRVFSARVEPVQMQSSNYQVEFMEVSPTIK